MSGSIIFDKHTSLTSEQVGIVERKLNIKFPKLFKNMIQKYNGGRFNDRNCFILFDTVFEVDSFMDFNLASQHNVLDYNTPLSDYYINGVVYFASTFDVFIDMLIVPDD